jgi:serine/threonine protein kinase
VPTIASTMGTNVAPVSGATCPECGEPIPDGVDACPIDGTPIKRADDDEAKLIGTFVGEYRVDAVIGSGGMGIVYRGVHPEIDKPVAIKVIRRHLAADPDYVRRLKVEARSVNAVRHRSVVDIFSIGALPDGRHYLVMELLEGESLAKIVEREAPMPFPAVTEILIEVCDALAAVHEAGVVHRDLKSSNIFVVTPPSGGRQVKLLDFGLAKKGVAPHAAIAQTSTSLVVGTPGFMAPEQARGAPVGPRTDLYALGAVAFEMVTGRKAFDAPTAIDVINLQLNSPVPLPSSLRRDVPPLLDALLVQMLDRDPEQRPWSARVIQSELRRLAIDRDAAPTRPARPQPVSTDARRRFRWAVSAGAALVLVGSATTLWLSSRLASSASPVVTAPPPPPPVTIPVPNPPPTEPRPPAPTESPLAKPASESVTQQQLLDRVDALARRLAASRKAGPETNVARFLLDKARQDALEAKTQQGRTQVSDFLDKWEEEQFREPK